MDNCFAACGSCGCVDNEGITKGDLDRFTDKIENVLNDEKGRRLFRNFMITSKMKDGRRTLSFWEDVERLLIGKDSSETMSPRNYLRAVDRLIDDAERIEELDFAAMERLTIARDSENKEEINEVLKILKVEATKALRREYGAFRRHFVLQQK
ncbi:uncharacterized protein LOC126369276 [Pectinophora gossypiella]|uniref:RGS domain-containing protein n=1 Tax=Pectinophora gossypiella TaxID=13191 RepID=A0A1E1W7Q3_PECGO|nr:uncharacterized protein LOC126369276 [Pectinophora gossypiella]